MAGRLVEHELAPVPVDLGAVTAAWLGDGVGRIRVPLPYPIVQSVNVYVLELPGRIALVDCGTSIGLGWKALQRGLELLGAYRSEVGTLVLTHTHADHAGLASRVRAMTGCRIVRGHGLDTINDALREPRRPRTARRARAIREGVPRGAEPEYVDPFVGDDGLHVRPAPHAYLADGAVLPGSDGRWRVLAAPGHSPNQICLVSDGGAMISADLVLPVRLPFLEWGHSADPVGEHRGSLERAERLEPRLLLPGHGAPVSDPRAAIARARAEVDRILAEALAALEPGRRSAFEVSRALCGPDRDLDRRQSSLAVALAALEHLQATGWVRAALDADGVRRFALAAADR